MVDLNEYEISLIGWMIQVSRNALVIEQEKDEPSISEESSTILIRRMIDLENKLTDHYAEKVNAEDE